MNDAQRLARENTKARREIRAKERYNGWISVEKRLPEEDGSYLAHHNEVVFSVIYEDGSFYVPTFNSRVRGFSTIVTHWQPLPEPPSDE